MLLVELYRETHVLQPGRYTYLPPASGWSLHNRGEREARFHWIRKPYEKVPGLDTPEPLFLNEQDIKPNAMPGMEGKWATTRFIDPLDLRHDMHVTIVTFQPAAVTPFAETHVMEHGLYVLEGKAVYQLNQDGVEVEAGDFRRLRVFCRPAMPAAAVNFATCFTRVCFGVQNWL